MPSLVKQFCLLAFQFSAVASVELNKEACAVHLTEPSGDLHLLQANAKKVAPDDLSASVADSRSDWLPATRPPLVSNKLQQQIGSHDVSEAQGTWSGTCDRQNMIWDIGFFDGYDAQMYLEAGFCVVAVEADPTLVDMGKKRYAAKIESKQLTLLNVAVAPGASPGGNTTFYLNRCKAEWNSFLRTVGCRACTAPHVINTDACQAVQVSSTRCADLFTEYGTPHYLKLDIEGAESGCFHALKTLAQMESRISLPKLVSAEVSSPEYIDELHNLGYTKFKLVRQDKLIIDNHSSSGPWGDKAMDCRTGATWRTYQQVREEMLRVSEPWSGVIGDDPCPKGVEDIKKEGKGTVWYDVHASL